MMTMIVGLILLGLIIAAVVTMIRNKKKGICSGNCSGCSFAGDSSAQCGGCVSLNSCEDSKQDTDHSNI